MLVSSEAGLTEAYLRRRCAVCGGEAAVHRPGSAAVYQTKSVRSPDGVRRINTLVTPAIAERDLCIVHGLGSSVPRQSRRRIRHG